ncbi:MAG: hypothetical protein GWN11_08305 [Candidatus Dadabacteria bacterium]|nr:hypothetical protein [Candidatus Dadabacteria bacterium]
MKYLFLLAISLSLFIIPINSSAEDVPERYKVVIEESYYVIAYENKEEFMKIYKEMIFPFWREMKKMGLIEDDIKMYSQRIHPKKPHWTHKTIIRFKNYHAIDKWLASREEVVNRLFPKEGGYKKMRARIAAITEAHWDDLVRELPLDE